MALRSIQPIEIKWGNDIVNTITQLELQIAKDNLFNACSFNYGLLNDSLESVSGGTIEIMGIEYVNWDGNNEFPFTYVANQLGLTLI